MYLTSILKTRIVIGLSQCTDHSLDCDKLLDAV